MVFENVIKNLFKIFIKLIWDMGSLVFYMLQDDESELWTHE